MTNEFQVMARSLGDYAETVPFGWIGEEAPPAGMSGEEYVQTIEFRDGQRFVKFQRPFRPNLKTRVVVTDADNGMWVPDRLLESADPV